MNQDNEEKIKATPEIREQLRQVSNLLSGSEKWTGGVMARKPAIKEAVDDYKVPTYAQDPKADCWCLEGAFIKVAGNRSSLAELYLKQKLGKASLAGWNDALYAGPPSREMGWAELKCELIRAQEICDRELKESQI